jgi:hypothetical protein
MKKLFTPTNLLIIGVGLVVFYVLRKRRKNEEEAVVVAQVTEPVQTDVSQGDLFNKRFTATGRY